MIEAARGRGANRRVAAAQLDRIIAEMQERGVRPGRLTILAAATDRGLSSKTVALIDRIAEQRLQERQP
jgi:hypothetical protein